MAPHRDIELNNLKFKEDSLGQGSSYSMHNFSMREPSYEPGHRGTWSRFIESFERDPDRRIAPKTAASRSRDVEDANETDSLHDGAHYYDLQHATLVTSNPSLARKLKGRHLQMIAIGGSIGRSALPSPRRPPLTNMSRNRSIHRIGQGSGRWRARLFAHRILTYRRHALLHMSGSR